MCEKRKKNAEPEMGYCPFEHRHWVTIQSLYRDTEAGRLAWLGGKVCRNTPSVSWLRLRERLEEVCHDTSNCIVTRSLDWPMGGCVTIQQLYHDKRSV